MIPEPEQGYITLMPWIAKTFGLKTLAITSTERNGVLLVPKDLKPGEKRPVVVCQHGLEGRPSDISDPAVNSQYYHQYGLRLAERGFDRRYATAVLAMIAGLDRKSVV